MTLWEALVLGAVQGATEFLPVSSSGHLVMAEALMDISLPGVAFEVVVHVATLASVIVVYRERVWALAKGALARNRDSWRYLGLLALATVPAGLVGILLGDLVEALFDRAVVPGAALLVTGGLLWSTRGLLRSRGREDREDGDEGGGTDGGGAVDLSRGPGAREALVMGAAQAFALIPGISRSGTTVVVGLWLGLEAREAAAFSFLMAVPAILGAATLQGPYWPGVAGGQDVGAYALAFGAAAVVGILAIRTFVAMLAHGAFHRFAIYCWLVGGAFLVWLGTA